MTFPSRLRKSITHYQSLLEIVLTRTDVNSVQNLSELVLHDL